MQIDLSSIDTVQFNVREGLFCGEESVLVTPALQGCEWNKDNLIFRSSVWRKSDGKLLSPGLPKFFNLGEKPDLNPTPDSLVGWSILDKIDGSLLCATCHNGQIQIRSRGTFNAQTLDNGAEFYELLNRCPDFAEHILNAESDSFILEIVSPNQKIIVDYPELDFYLLHIIRKSDYVLRNDKYVDQIAEVLKLKRPRRYDFTDFNSLVESVKVWPATQEGVVIRKDQQLIKIKSLSYLKLHSFKSDLSLKNLLEIFLDNPNQSQNEFLNFIESNFDHECMVVSRPIVERIEGARGEVNKILDKVDLFVHDFKDNLSRKEFALVAKFELKDHAGLAFGKLDGKALDKKTLKKLYYAQLKL